MSTFYFHLDNEQPLHDAEGTELADIEDARSHANTVARELMRGRDGMLGHDWSRWTMRVQDHNGADVFSFALSNVTG